MCTFVDEHVVNGSQSVSLKDSRLRAKVKKRREQEFAENIVFIRVAFHESEIVVSKGTLMAKTLTTFIKGSRAFVLKEAAAIIRSEILEMINTVFTRERNGKVGRQSTTNRRSSKG